MFRLFIKDRSLTFSVRNKSVNLKLDSTLQKLVLFHVKIVDCVSIAQKKKKIQLMFVIYVT
jgi:hypothetical protein